MKVINKIKTIILLSSLVCFSRSVLSDDFVKQIEKATDFYDDEKYEKAIPILQSVIDNPNASFNAKEQSLYLMAQLHYYGLGVPKDYKKSSQLFSRFIAEYNSYFKKIKATNKPKKRLVYHITFTKNKKKVRLNFSLSDAQYMLGMIYYKGGYGVEKNYALAAEYFKQANTPKGVENSSEIFFSSFELGNIYFEGGHGVKKDYHLADLYFTDVLNWDENAEEMDSWIYYRYLPAETVKIAKARIDEIKQIAVNHSDADKAKAYYRGSPSVSKDYKLAIEFYQNVINNSYSHPEDRAAALFNMGDIYFNGGFGIAKNYQKAIKYYTDVINDLSASLDEKETARSNIAKMNLL